MTALRLFAMTVIALGGCSRSSPMMQPDAPATMVAPEPAKGAAGAEKFWSDTIRPLATLSRGWNRIPGRYGTGCAHDSTFAFKVRPGLPEKILVFLNGGGACWRAQECDPKSRPTYTMTADSANDAAARTGIFDTNNEKNPVREYTMVFVPYCTGDLHLGTREIGYEWTPPKGIERDFAVRHGGAANLEAVLDWVYANVKNPQTVFVAGVSAGAIPSPVVAQKIARHYPRARVVQLGDGAGGYRSPNIPATLWQWGATEYLKRDPGFGNLDSASFTFNQLYATSARVAPQVRYAQFNTVDDATQIAFLGLLGVRNAVLPKLLAANIGELKGEVSWFRSYLAPGKAHTILRSNALYSTSVEGVKFVDWLRSLVNGEEVNDVGAKLLAVKKP